MARPATRESVDFDPHKLNPNENARLKIEADKFPALANFEVEMGGKLYFRRSDTKPQNLYEGLFIPPGVTEFRVTAGEPPNRKVSNIVSAEFKARKKKTLRIELRSQGQSTTAGMPAAVYPDSQIVISLK